MFIPKNNSVINDVPSLMVTIAAGCMIAMATANYISQMQRAGSAPGNPQHSHSPPLNSSSEDTSIRDPTSAKSKVYSGSARQDNDRARQLPVLTGKNLGNSQLQLNDHQNNKNGSQRPSASHGREESLVTSHKTRKPSHRNGIGSFPRC